ncbi:hypothetical protein [Vibrio alginolyticus]|uniref:hypothetical protein n=1 Tax=Vibrio alginolyticus TaxID=663 RepID=UPI001BD60BB5|nr:hypothetical protein [Vibrio alginolyticus]MBS9974650.1 hypothetical protein [Vibrio alginolyticus]MBT0020099.1 hypothetical protein [Vibrio alginolyticus]
MSRSSSKIFNPINTSDDSSKSASKIKNPDDGDKEKAQELVGDLGYFLGTGKNAQDSVVWLTIKWSFFIGIGISVVIVLYMMYFTPKFLPICDPSYKPTFPMEYIKSTWAIFVPIITLALGYMFGKGGK